MKTRDVHDVLVILCGECARYAPYTTMPQPLYSKSSEGDLGNGAQKYIDVNINEYRIYNPAAIPRSSAGGMLVSKSFIYVYLYVYIYVQIYL